jgi:hypothetical protein
MIAKGANLYPSSTREALSNMTKSGVVTRNKLETTGSGKKPFVYEAIPPGELLKIKLGGIETLLNRLQNLDVYIRGERTVTYRRGPYKVRIEKLIDENGEERVFIESEGGENQKEDTDDKVEQGS